LTFAELLEFEGGFGIHDDWLATTEEEKESLKEVADSESPTNISTVQAGSVIC
jgi:hypothetical protein